MKFSRYLGGIGMKQEQTRHNLRCADLGGQETPENLFSTTPLEESPCHRTVTDKLWRILARLQAIFRNTTVACSRLPKSQVHEKHC